MRISEHSIVTVGESSSSDIVSDMLPLHRFLERGQFAACASSLVVFLAEEHGTSRFASTLLEFTSAMIWLLGVALVSSAFFETSLIEVVGSLDPGGSAHSKFLYQILISIQIAFRLLFSNLRCTVSKPPFADSMLEEMLLRFIISIRVSSPGSPGIIELLVIAGGFFFSESRMASFHSQFFYTPSDPVLFSHGNVSQTEMFGQVLISLQVANGLLIRHVGPSLSM